jgi:hypothetical protein
MIVVHPTAICLPFPPGFASPEPNVGIIIGIGHSLRWGGTRFGEKVSNPGKHTHKDQYAKQYQ